MWSTGLAHIASVQQQPMMRQRNYVLGQVFHKFLFHRKRCGTPGANKSKAMTDTENMGVYCHTRLAEYDGLDNIGSLPPYPGQFFKFFSRGRHFATIFIHKHLCHTDKMP